MTNPSFVPEGHQGSGPEGGTTKKTFSESAAGVVRDAASQSRQAVLDTASTVGSQVKGLLNDQVEQGADMVAHFANATKKAADELANDAPQSARLVRGVANRLDDYADGLRDQSIDDLMRSASDFTRRQPAMVFGLAAVVGFFALRTFKSASARSISPNRAYEPTAPRGGPYGR
jgi:hypothetical protein